MEPLVLGIIVFSIVAILVVALFYVGSKLIYNVTSDIANATSSTTATNNEPNKPPIPDSPNSPTVTTTTVPLSQGNLELWNQPGFQGTMTSIPINNIQPYGSIGPIALDPSIKSIRFPSSGYMVYLCYSSDSVPITPEDVKDITKFPNSTSLPSETYSLPIISSSSFFYIAIFSNATTPIPTTAIITTPLPNISEILEFYTDTNFTGTKYTINAYALPVVDGFNKNNLVDIDLSSVVIKSLRFPPNVELRGMYTNDIERALQNSNGNIDKANTNILTYPFVFGYVFQNSTPIMPPFDATNVLNYFIGHRTS